MGRREEASRHTEVAPVSLTPSLSEAQQNGLRAARSLTLRSGQFHADLFRNAGCRSSDAVMLATSGAAQEYLGWVIYIHPVCEADSRASGPATKGFFLMERSGDILVLDGAVYEDPHRIKARNGWVLAQAVDVADYPMDWLGSGDYLEATFNQIRSAEGRLWGELQNLQSRTMPGKRPGQTP